MNTDILKRYPPQKGSVTIHGQTAVFEVPTSDIRETVADLRKEKHLNLKLVTATDEREEEGCFKIWYVFGASDAHAFVVPFICVKEEESFPSIAFDVHEAWNDERKIRTFFGLTPEGHPDERTILLHETWPTNVYPLRKDVAWNTKHKNANGTYPFQKVEGEGIYEIPVGPIHAGIIEPGHFRFSVAGEEIVLLEPRLGYTHKGSEKLFEILPTEDLVRLSEKISGDSSFSHSLAFCQALEQLRDVKTPKRACYLRVVYAELERLANHFGDIGAIMTDTGFNFGGAQGARLRETIMQIHERLTGSRFLRGVNVCGGVTKDLNTDQKNHLLKELGEIRKDFAEVLEVAEHSTSLINRLKGTGELSLAIAEDHGATGVAARAVGIKTDARVDYPYAAYEELGFKKIETEQSGDVYARFRIRVKEVGASLDGIERVLKTMPNGSIKAGDTNGFKKDAVAVSMVEGWRGEICYFLRTNAQGKLVRVAPRDPSCVNWRLLGHAGLGNMVPDFPLINKSFNLSYTGNDV